ncbi:MAG: hypothetical protein AAF335_03350, partial [Bacteroidota bacterium]
MKQYTLFRLTTIFSLAIPMICIQAAGGKTKQNVLLDKIINYYSPQKKEDDFSFRERDKGFSFLEEAIAANNKEAIQYLLKEKSDELKHKIDDIIKYLKRENIDINVELLKTFFDHDKYKQAFIDKEQYSGDLIKSATQKGKEKVVEYLLAKNDIKYEYIV